MRLRILLSFHYYRRTDVARLAASFPEPPEIFADSGAFSAKSVGAEVTVGEYAAWLRQWGHLFVAAANLDVIGDAAATLTNQRRMEDLGFGVLPVFHGGEPWGYLSDYCQRYPYVALGGMVATGGAPAVLRWAVHAFRIGRTHGTVFHGFGQTTVPILKALPWYSVDSSSWGSGHRYGQLSLWDDRRARFAQVQLGDRKAVYALAPLIRAHGGDPAELAERRYSSVRDGVGIDRVRFERAHVIGVNVAAWLRLEAWLRQHHGPVLGPAGAGSRVHLANTGGAATRLAHVTTGTDGVVVRDTNDVGPRVFLADSRGAAAYTERQDLALAAHRLNEGPSVYFTDSDAANRLAASESVAGPKVYFAEGVPRNLQAAAQAVGTRGVGG